MTETTQTVQDADSLSEKLIAMGQGLAAVASDKVKRREKMAEIEELLGNIKIKDFPELAESPIIQQFVEMFTEEDVDLKPGQSKRRGTLAERVKNWTYRDLGQFEQVRFTPNETILLVWNGLPLQVIADEECVVPKPYKDLYEEHRFAVKQAQLNEKWMLGIKGAVAPHPNWLSAESAMVRAYTELGYGHLSTGPIAIDPLPEESTDE